jgi:hypothetical protein
MISDESSQDRRRPRPPRGFSVTPPPGFYKPEGRSFILVYGDRVRELVGAIGAAVASRVGARAE